MLKYISIFVFLIVSQITVSFSSYVCKEGSNNCARCNPVTKLCVKCQSNIFSLNKKGECEASNKCILGENYCLECNEEGNLCEKCDEGFYPDNNGGCSYSENCQMSYQGKCISCETNFVLNSQLGICKSQYSEDFKNCKKVNTNTGLCRECQEGYYLNEIDKDIFYLIYLYQ